MFLNDKLSIKKIKKIFNSLNEKPKFRDIYFLLILFAFIIRIIHLNYNSPFSDEAVYVVVGKMGVFQDDWWSYNATSWMGGSPYFYPTISAISYVTGGILGSRLFNIILSVLSVEVTLRITLLLNKSKSKISILSGLISASIIAFASTSIYISRLATYDMPAFFFMIMGFYLLLLAENKKVFAGKYYFLSSLFIMLAILTKIITLIYLPILLLYSLIRSRRLSKKWNVYQSLSFYWLRYFIPPLILGFILYLTTNIGDVYTFFKLQSTRERAGFMEIISSSATYILPVIPLFIAGTLGFIRKKFFKMWIALTFLASLPIAVHALTSRLISLDKHIFMSLFFISILVGIGISNIINTNLSYLNKWKYHLLAFSFSVFFLLSFQLSLQYNYFWNNSSQMLGFMKKKVKSNDLVLAENGPEVILTTYDNNFPTHTTTFDYITYREHEELDAYRKAVLDGYYNYIELEKERDSKTERYKDIGSLVVNVIDENYELAYSDENYFVYQRKY